MYPEREAEAKWDDIFPDFPQASCVYHTNTDFPSVSQDGCFRTTAPNTTAADLETAWRTSWWIRTPVIFSGLRDCIHFLGPRRSFQITCIMWIFWSKTVKEYIVSLRWFPFLCILQVHEDVGAMMHILADGFAIFCWTTVGGSNVARNVISRGSEEDCWQMHDFKYSKNQPTRRKMLSTHLSDTEDSHNLFGVRNTECKHKFCLFTRESQTAPLKLHSSYNLHKNRPFRNIPDI